MKQFFLTALTCLALTQFTHAQLTLTQAKQEPVSGDISYFLEYDSTAAIPKNLGANQNWNFSSLTPTTFTSSSTYTTPSAVAASSLFTGVTLVENAGNGDYNFYKSTPNSQFELLGSFNNTPPFPSGVKFTDASIAAKWPMASGTTFTDSFAGTFVGASGTIQGTQTVTCSGTGTITLPGGTSYGNIVQVKRTQQLVSSASILTISLTYTMVSTEYSYYHPTQKFPLLTISYEIGNDGTTIDTTITIKVNKNITVGIKDNSIETLYSFYPNPAKDSFNFKLSNTGNEPCSLHIYNTSGQCVVKQELGNATTIDETIDVSHLSPGIYFVNARQGQRSGTRKLIID
jgi:hypothetical protein